MSRMFKNGSFEEDLAKGMEEKLVARQNEHQFSFDRIAKAVDFLNAASEIFDDTGFYAEAEVLTKMLERIADKKLRPKTAHQKPEDKEIIELESILPSRSLPEDEDIIEFESILDPKKKV